MKSLRKINKGLILTIIVLLALIVYLVNVENQRKEDKEDIKKACEEFISFTDKYSVLPEDMQKLTEPVSESKVEEYKKEMKTELEKLMINNEEAVKLQYQNLESCLDYGYNNDSEGIRSNLERKITKISSYEFEGNQVTVTFDAKLKTTSKYINEENEEQERQDSIDIENDEIILQKVDGKWKIVYSNLQYRNNYDYYVEDSMGMY